MTTRTDFVPISDAEIAASAESLGRLRDALNTVLFGQEALIEMVMIGLLSRGHLLLEGLPGLGKTELVKGLAKALRLDSKRIQFTPDLLPGDITGNPVLQEVDGRRSFVFQPGPLFANLVLADEINRASPKTQSALLEAMQERQVTVMGMTPHAARSVLRPGDAKPDRAGRDLPAAGSATRPLPPEDRGETQRGGDARENRPAPKNRRRARRARGAEPRGPDPSAGPRAANLSAAGGGQLHCAPG